MSGLRQPGRGQSARYPATGTLPRVRERASARLLLDTHVFLWLVGDDPRLSMTARRSLVASDSELFLSTASAWEIAIKTGLGRLTFNRDLESFMADHLTANRITPLPISLEHAIYVGCLPDHHRDPFDRLLVAQCVLEGMAVVSGDRMMAKYGVEVVW